MAYSIDRMPERISIGRETETGVTDVIIDCGAWVSKWPGLTISAMHTPQGGSPYVLDTELQGDTLVWHVSDADTASAGEGQMEIIGTAEGVRKLSCVVGVVVTGRMPGTVGDAPEAAKPWADKVLAAAESVRSSAEEARESAGSAQASAEAAQEAAEGVVTAEAERVQAEHVRVQAEQARQEAEKAREEVLPSKLTEPSSGIEVGKYFRIAAIDQNGHAVLEAVDAPVGGLSTEPSLWPLWTSDEQSAARERMGEFTDSALTTVADVTMDDDANILNAQLAKPCRFVACTFIIPPEDTGKSRNIYFAANLDGGASVTEMFTRSAPVSTSATMSAFYLTSALIVGGKILSFGCIASTGISILDHQTRALNNPPNGYCVMTADNFESISVYTYGDAFPAGSQLVVTGC